MTPTVSEYALKDPRAVAPAAQALSSADAAEARSSAGGAVVAVTAASSPVDLPGGLSVLGVSWEQGSGAGASVQYRTATRGPWSDWEFLEVDAGHGPDAAEEAEAAEGGRQVRDGSDLLVLLSGAKVQVRVIAPASASSPGRPELQVIDPGTSPADASTGLTAPGAAVAAAQKPEILSRADWGADESLRTDGPGLGSVTAAFVHHTVHIDDPNHPNAVNEYTAEQVPGIIRGIYSAHLARGYADIGYNFFVDRFGRTWEGRWGGVDRPVIGAQARGVNDETFGAAVLGNFEIAEPPTAVLDALTKLVAWKADIHGYDPAGTTVIDEVTYPTVEGHRNAKDNSTLCPGEYLLAKLPQIRTAAAAITDGTALTVERWAGANRYATAAAVSAATFPGGAPTAIVATAADFPDALAGGPAGAELHGPVLLTARDGLPDSTTEELQRLAPGRIVVLGGPGAVSESVAEELASLAPEVVRVAGQDRFETAAAVSAMAYPEGAPIAFVATAANFPDALAGGPAGARLDGPMLLAGADSIPPVMLAELERLAPERVVLLGGPGVVSDAVAAQVLSATGVEAERWYGVDRYETAATTSANAFPDGADVVLVATGADFPDALAGGPSGGDFAAPLLLTGRDGLPDATLAELKRLGPNRIFVLGGPGVVSEAVMSQLRGYRAD